MKIDVDLNKLSMSELVELARKIAIEELKEEKVGLATKNPTTAMNQISDPNA